MAASATPIVIAAAIATMNALIRVVIGLFIVVFPFVKAHGRMVESCRRIDKIAALAQLADGNDSVEIWVCLRM